MLFQWAEYAVYIWFIGITSWAIVLQLIDRWKETEVQEESVAFFV